ncbi:hypothetical protein ACAW74_16755 [Fibrella sp. WM1]|uniref:hypothetical protein n=1 Tax=Fibrella musci TaxID=3242485 RepID=UPI00352265AD
MGWFVDDRDVYFFKKPPPSLEAILEQIHARTGLRPDKGKVYPDNLGETTLELFNPDDDRDGFELTIGADFVRVTAFASLTYLAYAALYALIDLGGIHPHQLAKWPSKRWSEVATRVKELPYHMHPDWLFD